MRLLEVLLMTLAGIWQGLRQDFNLLEIVLVVAGFWAWKSGRLPRLRLPPRFERPWLAALVLALASVALRIALLPVLPAPVPVVSDEFSHLLLADTLLHGRAANPTHLFWEHFETLHVLQTPHYGSDYFPGHAAILAAARAVTGNPWAGILAESAVFLAILFWMLRSWAIPPRWALFGVLLAALRFSIGSYWINAFHGGFLPAVGGALVAGAFARLRRSGSVYYGVVFGIGLAMLASTRPFEGILFSIPFIAVLLWERRIVALVPAALVAGAAVCGLGVYFAKVTGSPFVTGYQVNQKAYGWPMGLAWTPPPVVHLRHVELQRYYDYELGERQKVDGPVDFVEYLTFRLQEYWRFFLGPVLTVPLIMIGSVWRRRRMLILGFCGIVFAILLEGAASPHYLAPATALIVAIVVECSRHLAARRVPVMLLAASMALVLTLRIAAENLGLPYTQKLNYQSWCCKVRGNMNKASITAALEQIPGNHLVLVKAKTDENNLLQWIYNDAEIDAARIVWARDLGDERNAQLAEHFTGRQVWVVDPNVEPATCRKY